MPRLPNRRALALAMSFALTFTAGLHAQPAPPPAPAEVPEAALAPAEPKPQSETELCTLIESAAKAHGLPVAFFTRLIWKESRFRTDAVSPQGGPGIAKFMPGRRRSEACSTLSIRSPALPASASLPGRSQRPLR
jgi:soluble lytic murein transglycosylase-like protein